MGMGEMYWNTLKTGRAYYSLKFESISNKNWELNKNQAKQTPRKSFTPTNVFIGDNT